MSRFLWNFALVLGCLGFVGGLGALLSWIERRFGPARAWAAFALLIAAVIAGMLTAAQMAVSR